MKSAILRWSIYLAALLVFGPLAGWLTGVLRAPDGGPGATPLVCSAPVAGILAGIGAIGIALAVGLVASILLGAPTGFSAAGLVLAWAAWRTGEITELIRAAHSAAPLKSLSLEGLLFGAFALALAAFLAAAVGAWLVAVTPLKGQAVAAATFGGILAAAVGRLTDPEAPLPLLTAPVLLLGIVAPFTGFILKGYPDVVHAAYGGALFPTANVLPLDYIAGAFLGVPLGVSWATSMSSGRIGP